jgi:hypothetical protein
VESAPAAVYQPRNPRATSLFALVEDYYEEFERVYDDRYQQQYGAWRPVIGEVMRKYLECGDLPSLRPNRNRTTSAATANAPGPG